MIEKQKVNNIVYNIRHKPLDELMAFTICGLGVIVLSILTIINPYSTNAIPLPDIGGIFNMTILVILTLGMIWIYKYGWMKTSGMFFLYYGFHEFCTNTIWLGAYGMTMFTANNIGIEYTTSNPFWDLRLVIIWTSIISIMVLRLYHINKYSIITGMIFLGYFICLLFIQPFLFFYGESFVPLSVIPQFEVFLQSTGLFAPFFYFLIRPKSESFAIKQ